MLHQALNDHQAQVQRAGGRPGDTLKMMGEPT